MSGQSFKDLLVWQRARDFSLEIYRVFSSTKDYGFKDQVQRAALSIPNNIAEGYARRSDKALRNFLFIAKSSAAEVESMLLIADKLDYIDSSKGAKLMSQAQEIQKLLSGFIKKL